MPHNLVPVEHVEAMRARLPHHMSSTVNLDAILAASADGFQQLETALLDLQLLRTIDTATGIQLDGIGQIINVPRLGGQTDDSYRFALKTVTIILTKSGEPEAVIEAYLLVMGAAEAEYLEIYPAAFQLSALPTVDINDPDTSAFITATMNAVKAAGVRMVLATVAAFERQHGRYIAAYSYRRSLHSPGGNDHWPRQQAAHVLCVDQGRDTYRRCAIENTGWGRRGDRGAIFYTDGELATVPDIRFLRCGTGREHSSIYRSRKRYRIGRRFAANLGGHVVRDNEHRSQYAVGGFRVRQRRLAQDKCNRN